MTSLVRPILAGSALSKKAIPTLRIVVHPYRLCEYLLVKRIQIVLQDHEDWYLKEIKHTKYKELLETNRYYSTNEFVDNWTYVDVGKFPSVDNFQQLLQVINPTTRITFLDKEENSKEGTTEIAWKDCKYDYRNDVLR